MLALRISGLIKNEGFQSEIEKEHSHEETRCFSPYEWDVLTRQEKSPNFMMAQSEKEQCYLNKYSFYNFIKYFF